MSCGSVKYLILALAMALPLLSGPAWGADIYVPPDESEAGSAAQGKLSQGAQLLELKDCFGGKVTAYKMHSEIEKLFCVFTVACTGGAKEFYSPPGYHVCGKANEAMLGNKDVRVSYSEKEGYGNEAAFIWLEQAPPDPDEKWR